MPEREKAGTDQPTMSPQDKQESARAQLTDLVSDLESVSHSITALVENPVADPQHFYLEGARLAALATDMSTARRDNLTELAARDPDRVSINRLATLTNVAVNTIRNRLGLNPGSEQRRVTDKPVF